MKRAGHRVSKTTLSTLQLSIEKYLKNLPPQILRIQNMDSIEIRKMTTGAYNLNFQISVDNVEFIFRVNIDQQSGLRKQIAYEYNALKFLDGYEIAPAVYHMDDTRAYFEFDILIEQYLEGPYLTLEKSQTSNVAELLVKLHSLNPAGMNFITWKDPLRDNYNFVKEDIAHYRTRKTAEKKILSLAERILEEIRLRISKSRLLFQADSLNHTDVVCDNFIKTSQGLRMIDWEKPRVDDVSYDLSCFLSRPAQLWCSAHVLSEEERDAFIKKYACLSGNNDEILRKKVHIREPMVSMHWILWGATKLCDLREDRTTPELLGAHEEKIPRYEKIARVENLEKLLSLLQNDGQ